MAKHPLSDVTKVAALREETIENAKLLAAPIDFDELVKSGILRPINGGWYELLRADLLPSYVSEQATAMKQHMNRGESRKFLKIGKKNATAAKIYLRLTGKAFKAW